MPPDKTMNTQSSRSRFRGAPQSTRQGQRPYGRSSGRSRFSSHKGGGGGRGRRHTGSYIDPSRFIHKAVTTAETTQPAPKHTFSDFGLNEKLTKAIIEKGYTEPTPIQDQTIPHIMKGRDIVGLANTGTGKTGAFLIPLIDKVLANPREQIIIVAPTRELATQINQELRSFTKNLSIYSTCCVGGAPIWSQIKQLKLKNNFVIGTPGRLKDLVERRSINLAAFSTIVLDEADRMLDMGFVDDIRLLMSGMPQKRHTLFFSATLSKVIEALIAQFLTDPVRISAVARETGENIEQDIVRVHRGSDKLEALQTLLCQEEFKKVIVFGATKHGVEKLSQHLVQCGLKAESIHGDKTFAKRVRALKLFKEDSVQILVATDVAARGLDIADVTHVINFDLPQTYEDYVHRIGRTGRGTKKGKALTFVT